MNVKTALAVQILCTVILLLLIFVRLWVSYRKRWLPVSSERWGSGLFVLACCMCLCLTTYWIADNAQQIIWEKQGKEPIWIRLALMEPTKWKGIYGTTLISATCMWVGKFSFLLLYVPSYRQFPRKAQILFIVGAVFTVLCFFTILSIFIFYCYPIERNWAVFSPQFCSTTLSLAPLNITLALSIVSDVLLFALPIILIYQLHSNSRSERYSIFFLLFLGLASVIATAYFVLDTHVNNYTSGTPLTLAKRHAFILDQVLANLLLLAAIAMPSVRLLFRSKKEKRQRLEGMSPIVRVKSSRGDDEIGLEMRRLHGAYGEDIRIEHGETGRPF